jgi:hypothetical protein
MQMPAGRLSPPGGFLFGACFLQRESPFRSNSPCVKPSILGPIKQIRAITEARLLHLGIG